MQNYPFQKQFDTQLCQSMGQIINTNFSTASFSTSYIYIIISSFCVKSRFANLKGFENL